MTSRYIFNLLILAALLTGCKKNQDFLIDQRSSFESYLDRNDLDYTVEGGAYRYVANADRPDYKTDRVVAYGDSVTFDFGAYLFGSPLGSMFYSNIAAWIPATDKTLNTEYWSLEPMKIRLGSTQLIKGLESGLVGNRENDSLLVFLTSDLAYGTHNIGVVKPDSPTVWVIKIGKVK